MSYYQMSIEDIENQKILQAMSDRTAILTNTVASVLIFPQLEHLNIIFFVQ